MAKGIKTGGRVAGTPNKATASIKAAIQAVYDKLQQAAGGDHAHFLAWAEEEPTEFYRLASKLIPVQVGGDPEGVPLAVVSTAEAPTEVLRWIASQGVHERSPTAH